VPVVVEAMKRALDLFCCDGGAAMGLFDAGFDEIVGIDIEPHPNYPFDFIQADATNPPVDLSEFHFIWASPPCQMFTSATKTNAKKHSRRRGIYKNLIPETRILLEGSGLPFCIENVPGAPIRKDLLLCGEMFGLRVIRHRIFEVHGFRAEKLRHPHHKKHSGCYYYSICGDTAPSQERRKRILHNLNQQPTREEWQGAMCMPWSKSKKNIAEAVPPAYSKYIASEFFRTGDIK